MAYVQSKVMKKRLQEKRRVSGAALLREELNNDGSTGSSLLDGLPVVQHDKGVMMANFEEWIKMATDNKINSTNSWNFALIDYFHDMNVLRESDNNINFQKASATLDGCVKIYSSRVDSAATETGRLLSGLATRKDSKESEKEDGDDEEEDKNDEDDEDDPENQGTGETYKGEEGKKKTKKSKSKDSENTLTTFENIRIKKLSLELAIDPLFKKTLSEFDEGGAKSLLLNTLSMDNHSRVVFDANSTNANDENAEIELDVAEKDEVEDVEMSGIQEDIDISVFKKFLFADDSELNDLVVCPSISHLETVLKDINQAKSILNDVNQRNTDEELPPADFDFDFGNADDDGGFDFVDDGNENSYGELDEEAAAVIFQDELAPDQVEVADQSGVIASVVDQDLMAYFDNTMKRNWAGPEHWKVTQLKKEKATEVQNIIGPNGQKVKKSKELFTIDFLSLDDEDDSSREEKLIFAKGKTVTTIPQDQWNTDETNLLPNDLYFSSAQLTTLFLKPSQRMNLFRRKVNVRSVTNSEEPEERREVDATFWAENYEENAKETEVAQKESNANDDDDDRYDMDLDFGGFDDYGDDDDAAATQSDEPANFGTQLITGGARVKPEYVNYSKTAKNVNIKKLKDNIWKVIEHEQAKEETESERQFSSVVKDIGRLYPNKQKKDLSTSFCFICLLHLANEHSLTLENNDDLTDLKIIGTN